MNILVIDDSRFSRRRIAEAIISAGHTVTEACDGQEGLGLIESASFDCVVTDNLMPVMGGIEMLRHLRAAGNAVPIVMCSADIQQSTRSTCEELGISGFVGKPFKPEQLTELVDRACDTGRECASCK